MSGSNAGTGNRFGARCAHCRGPLAIAPTAERMLSRTFGGLVRRGHDPGFVYRVRCAECGRLGWSRHNSMAQAWQQRQLLDNG